jgi:hypothetical protein
MVATKGGYRRDQQETVTRWIGLVVQDELAVWFRAVVVRLVWAGDPG